MFLNEDLNVILVRNVATNTELEMFTKKIETLIGEQLTEEKGCDLIQDIASIRYSLLQTNKMLIERYPISEEEKKKNLEVMAQLLEELENSKGNSR